MERREAAMNQRLRTPTMFGLLIRAVMISIVIVVAVAAASITYSTYQFVLDEKGASRIDILKQVSDSNDINRTNMKNVMGVVDSEIHDLLVDGADDALIHERLSEVQMLLDKIGLDYSIDIVMTDRRTFSSRADTEKSLNNLLNSYWYIKHLSGDTKTSWNLRFIDPDDISSYALVYGKTIFDDDDNVIGLIVLNSTQEVLFRTYQKLLEEGERVYILDENGIIVSHSSPGMIGTWYRVMDVFEEERGFNSYTIEERGSRRYIVANYHDPVSGWTFVEEHDITEILHSYYQMLQICLAVVILGALIAIWLGYFYVKKISRSLTRLADQVGALDENELHPIETSQAYYEIETLSKAFNQLVERVQHLIYDIQLREQEKRKTEYDFLQAQLSPHFLHNTLIAIKSLIAMGQTEQAGRMMEEFVELLHIPATAEVQFVTLEEEIHLVRSFISIMNCRTAKDVAFYDEISPQFRNVPVPRMLLQPVVGNSFFHGFAEREEDCEIHITAAAQGGTLQITVRDNGEGIAPERLHAVRSDQYASDGNHHGVGIRNIRKRLRILYGEKSDVELRSTVGEGTEVQLLIDRFDELPPTENILKDTKGGRLNT